MSIGRLWLVNDQTTPEYRVSSVVDKVERTIKSIGNAADRKQWRAKNRDYLTSGYEIFVDNREGTE